MRDALRTLIGGLFLIVFGLFWCQLLAAFWVPGGFAFLEAEICWLLNVGSCMLCVLLPLGILLFLVGVAWGFTELVRQLFRSRDGGLPRARVAQGLGGHRTARVLAHLRCLARARYF